MKIAIVLFALLAGWWLLSQGIAWAITPNKDPDEIVEHWRFVFLAPAVLVIVALNWALEQTNKRLY